MAISLPSDIPLKAVLKIGNDRVFVVQVCVFDSPAQRGLASHYLQEKAPNLPGIVPQTGDHVVPSITVFGI